MSLGLPSAGRGWVTVATDPARFGMPDPFGGSRIWLGGMLGRSTRPMAFCKPLWTLLWPFS